VSVETLSFWGGIIIALLSLAGVIYAAVRNPAGDIADAANKLIKPLSERVDELEQTNKETKTKFDQSEAEKLVLITKINELELDIRRMKADHAKEIKSIKAEAERENLSLKKEVAGLKMREGKLRRELSDTRQALKESNERIDRIKRELGTGPLPD
jgi:chromosome segregation ATPase